VSKEHKEHIDMKLVVSLLWFAYLGFQLQRASASTVFVSNSSSSSNTTSFLKALEDQAVTQIVLTDDYYAIGTSFDPYVPACGRGPLEINRCGTAAATAKVHLLHLCKHLRQS
jgi:hypothetical protein